MSEPFEGSAKKTENGGLGVSPVGGCIVVFGKSECSGAVLFLYRLGELFDRLGESEIHAIDAKMSSSQLEVDFAFAGKRQRPPDISSIDKQGEPKACLAEYTCTNADR